MPLTQREQKVLDELSAWENNLYDYEPNDFELTYDRYLERSFSLLPEEVQERFFTLFDGWLFHLHSLIQGSQLQMDAKERILSAGRVFQPDLETIQDLRELPIEQLEFIARQQIARHRLYSFVQGGMSGSGGNLVLGADMPAMAVINLRIVQLVAMTYGFEVNTPFEMMVALKVFHTATMPSRMQSAGWEELKNDLEQAEDYYFYEGNDDLTDVTWLEQPIKQIFKGMAILMFRKKHVQGMPVISMAIGAGANYQLTRRVTDFAHKFYQMRYFKEKGAL
ncbi:EcsC family protein [Mesobacillus selenatarsenatis]|uniref:Protein ecsC n=1 Tax=Mesobacillus selenatarsenatis (strain DSM 18680 / JCM 14380 / FERM P-15431 / SF-1) TaxID=1321606 RepID=A0A0A8X0S5_MESS1|nr:EcsC family protein [Mesobacillus selenatarsenatis]GAM13595.1 protein ecsC [Mesobacillus selenatarsenatis SF-1]